MKKFFKQFLVFLVISIISSVSGFNLSASENYTVMGTKNSVEALIGDAKIYTVSKYYFDNSKLAYQNDKEKPIIVNGEAYVSDSFIKNALKNLSFSVNDAENTIINDNIKYMRAEEAAKKLGFEYMFDTRGFFVFSNEAFTNINKDIQASGYTKYYNENMIYCYVYFDNPTKEQIILDLKNGGKWGVHPRIFYTSDDISYMKEKCQSETQWHKKYNLEISLAEQQMNLTDFTSSCTDGAKQGQAYKFQEAVSRLALAYALTEDEKYADQAIKYIDTLCEWETLAYNKSNLTTGHYAMGMAIGYDSFYNYLNQTEEGKAKLAKIRNVADKLPFTDTINAYKNHGGPHWITLNDNFLGVIGGGVLSLALAMADESDISSDLGYLIENVLKSLYVATSLYETNGGYYEGISYSNYMLKNLTIAIESLFSCTGGDYSLGTALGFKNAGKFISYMNTAKETFNFHDCGPDYSYSLISYWFAYRYGQTDSAELAYHLSDLYGFTGYIREYSYYTRAIDEHGNSNVYSSPLDMYFPVTEVGSFRNSFYGKEPTFVGIHGGKTGIPHDSLDAGEFVFEADGVLWAEDLGLDVYENLPDYFKREGYRIYRKRTEGENCLVINPKNLSYDEEEYFGQTIGESAKLLFFESAASGSMAAYDLSKLYKRDVTEYIRGYYFGDNRHTLTVQDEVTLKKESEMYWFMHTRANIDIKEKNTAYLTKDGKTLKVEIFCNGDDFEILDMPATHLVQLEIDGVESENTGIRKLAVYIPKASGDVTISVKLSPINDFYTPGSANAIPIKKWVLPQGDLFIEPIIKSADINLLGYLTCFVQIPYNTKSAHIYLDGRKIYDLSHLKNGEKHFINGVKIGKVSEGIHKAEIKAILENGETVSDLCMLEVSNATSRVHMSCLPDFGEIQKEEGNIKFSVITNNGHTVSNTYQNGFQITKNSETYARVHTTPKTPWRIGVVIMDMTFKFNKEGASLQLWSRENSDFKLGDRIISHGEIDDLETYKADEKINLKVIIDLEKNTYTRIVNNVVVLKDHIMPSATKLTDIFFELTQDTPVGTDMTILDLSVKHYLRNNINLSVAEDGSEVVSKLRIKDVSHFDNKSLLFILCQYNGNEIVDIKICPLTLEGNSLDFSEPFVRKQSSTKFTAMLINKQNLNTLAKYVFE